MREYHQSCQCLRQYYIFFICIVKFLAHNLFPAVRNWCKKCFLAGMCEVLFPFMESLSKIRPSITVVLVPVGVHCTVHRPHLLLLCNYCKGVIFNAHFIWDTRGLLTSGSESSCHQHSYNLLQQFPWVASSAFWWAPCCSWDPASALKRWEN